MKKYSRSVVLVLGVVLMLGSFAFVTTSIAADWHEVVIPYAYVGDGWDSVIIISNISNEVIAPQIAIRNLNEGEGIACYSVGELGIGKIFSSTFGSISGWCSGGGTVPIPGIFQVYVGCAELGPSDKPFGVAVAINNSSFGGFGFQQYKSENSAESAVFSVCNSCVY